MNALHVQLYSRRVILEWGGVQGADTRPMTRGRPAMGQVNPANLFKSPKITLTTGITDAAVQGRKHGTSPTSEVSAHSGH